VLEIFAYLIFWICFAFLYEWIDRKITARIQKRVGPFFTGKKGVLQPLADFIKLLAKEDIVPKGADKFIFSLAPFLALFLPLFSLFFIPLFEFNLSFEGDLLFLLYLLAFQTILLQLIGIVSISRFGSVGAGRVALQALTFEILLIFSGITPSILSGSLLLKNVSTHFFLPIAPIAFLLFAISLFAELEFLPFDIPEAPQEIVAGWQTELSGKKLAFIRLGKNLSALFGFSLLICLFFGFYNLSDFFVKLFGVIFCFSFFKNLFPRFRIDQALELGWKILFPLALLQIFIIII
jgi:NADH-quinone oxidoreductase subunit H